MPYSAGMLKFSNVIHVQKAFYVQREHNKKGVERA